MKTRCLNKAKTGHRTIVLSKTHSTPNSTETNAEIIEHHKAVESLDSSDDNVECQNSDKFCCS